MAGATAVGKLIDGVELAFDGFRVGRGLEVLSMASRAAAGIRAAGVH